MAPPAIFDMPPSSLPLVTKALLARGIVMVPYVREEGTFLCERERIKCALSYFEEQNSAQVIVTGAPASGWWNFLVGLPLNFHNARAQKHLFEDVHEALCHLGAKRVV